ncbi:putative serine carboxypeptidase [Xylariales sp. PMI_506]|nr:putative serine carboxypeptidase [Xylariales sp. PMI_506]
MALVQRLLLAFGALAVNTVAQFVPPPNNFTSVIGAAGVPVRYKEVPPGICELDPNVKSFSGYADVAENVHIFFWFFEARNQNASEAPLTVWLTGGPGGSSLVGLFQELGPCGVDNEGNVYNNPYSWSNVSNMLFIDQPAETGLSYSLPVPMYYDDYVEGFVQLGNEEACPSVVAELCGTYQLPSMKYTANSTLNAAPTFWSTLQGFMGAFPQYSRTGFHLATESYGGHYGPIFSEYIEEQNAKNIPDALQIKMESLMISNGWFDAAVQYAAQYNYSVSPGNTYGYYPYEDDVAEQYHNLVFGEGNCLFLIEECRNSAENFFINCYNALNVCQWGLLAFQELAGRDVGDIRELLPDPFPYDFYEAYLNTPAVQEALGAYVNYTEVQLNVNAAFVFEGDFLGDTNIYEDLAKLVAANVTVALLAGDADLNCNWLGVEAIAGRVGAPGFDEAGYANMTMSDGKSYGQTKQAGKFSFTRVYEAGHMVPFYQPLATLEMLQRVVNGLDVATGTVVAGPEYVTSGPQSSLWYQEGNATMQWEVLDPNTTYDPSTNGPGPLWNETTDL